VFLSAVRRRVSFESSLKQDLLQRAAAPVFVFRILEGLTAWLLFTHIAFGNALRHYGWPAYLLHLIFFTYFGVNTACYRRYRTRRATDPILWIDLGTNMGVMLVVAAHTGGLASPVMLLCLIKIAVYGFVFGPPIGIASITLMLVAVGFFVAGAELLGLDWVPGRMFVLTRLPGTMALHFLAVVGSLLASTWLFKQVAEGERQTRVEATRARRALEREHAAATVTAALLSVSEAVSRLTRMQDVLNKVVEIAPRILNANFCAIFLWNEEEGRYRGAAAAGIALAPLADLLSRHLRPDEAPDLEWIRRLGHCAVISPADAQRSIMEDAVTLLAAPLRSGGRFYGVIQFGRDSGKAFTQSDLRLGDGIAGQTAIAIERAHLLEQSHRLVRAVDSTDEAVLITDRNRRIVFANPAYMKMFGYMASELLGQDVSSVGVDYADFQTGGVPATMFERTWRGEAIGKHRDGTTLPISMHASVILGYDQKVDGAVVIIEDITARKQLQDQLARADRLAAAGELAAGVAHEVNNALVGILGYADLARQDTEQEVLHDAIQHIETQALRITRIIRELLGFARPTPPCRVPVDLSQLVRDTLGLMSHDLHRHHVAFEAPSSGLSPNVLADATQIQQVFVNLFKNAAHAVEGRRDGRLVVRIGEAGHFVEVEVEDNGPGIPPEVLPRVFDPFFSTREEGTGLGLSVSYAIVNAHGGKLEVRSTPGCGATFTLQLPRAAEEEFPEAHTVLLVDDDDEVAETLRDMLEREGLVVQRAASGAEALEALGRREYDIVFLDVRLPDISGPEIYQRVAVQYPQMARRVAFVTGGLWRADSRALRDQLPPQPLLGKPCTPVQIREVLGLLRDLRAAA